MKRDGDSAILWIWICFLTLIAIIGIGVTSCAPTETLTCVTRCGVILRDPVPPVDQRYYLNPPQWTCAELQRVEDLSMAAYARHVTDPRFEGGKACAAVRGYGLKINPQTSWDFLGIEVSGLTYCGLRSIEVGGTPPIRSSLTHELAHVVQDCAALGPIPANETTSGLQHENWTRDGITAAIDEVQAEGDREFGKVCQRPDGGRYLVATDAGACL